MKNALFLVGNHNTYAAIEDYIEKVVAWETPGLLSVTASPIFQDGFDLYIFLERFCDEKIKNLIISLRNRNPTSRFICVCTEPIEDETFHKHQQLKSFLEAATGIEGYLKNSKKPRTLRNLIRNPRILFGGHREIRNLERIVKELKNLDVHDMITRFENFSHLSQFFDLIVVQEGTGTFEAYQKIHSQVIPMQEFFIPPHRPRNPRKILHKAVCSGTNSFYRQKSLMMLGLAPVDPSGILKPTLFNTYAFTDYTTPNILRKEISAQSCCVLDLPVASVSALFSSEKANFAIRNQIPFLAKSQNLPENYAPFVWASADLLGLKILLEKISPQNSIEMGFETLKKIALLETREKLETWLREKLCR